MITFREDIKPNDFSVKINQVKESLFENGNVGLRLTVPTINRAELSFKMTKEEVIYFKDFYDNEINRGYDEFLANWDGSLSIFNILSDITYANGEGTNELYNVAFIVSYLPVPCTEDKKELNFSLDNEIMILKGLDTDYKNYKECDNNHIMLNHLLNNELDILRIFGYDSAQHNNDIKGIDYNGTDEDYCTAVVTSLIDATDDELEALTITAVDSLELADATTESIVVQIMEEINKHEGYLTL